MAENKGMAEKIAAVIVAAGSSSRMGGIKKEYLNLPGSFVAPDVQQPLNTSKPLTVLGSAAMAFAASKRITLIVFAIPAGGEEEARSTLPKEFFGMGKEVFFVHGGPTRQSSVYNALSLLEPHKPSIVLIHYGARPWIKTDLIERIIDAVLANGHGAAIPVMPMTETPKEIEFSGSEGTGIITRHLRRRELVVAQTPQGFNFPEILKAHEKAVGAEYTDDAEIWGEFIGPVAVIPGESENKKITFPGDLELQL
jgi:2-C-methyl-D-erythritol 4-phosphate cytidylyltransferase/2-C-methyl-D-erythritol 4-phosphate cytidylyltransferase/2-C-methyl-D-erythritol 2,4-cyclodiphosphate synthase